MKTLLSCILITIFIACSNKRNKVATEESVNLIYQKKYDTLRSYTKELLANGLKNVNDYNQAYTTVQAKSLDSTIENYERRTGFQMTVLVFDSLMTSQDSVNQVTQIIGIKNKIGTTIGISPPYRKLHIWNDSLINNKFLSQSETKYIIDNDIVPYFRNGEYFKGTEEGLRKLITIIVEQSKTK